ncbi:uncharacterized protein LOC133172128 [Saccostrea echinata]|uniref:uncharacterized protein LOC133172128 n=1 Tax=Saccostrea echinata TaxID=191078 RepID=UPI002A81D679|nr:uncharacterized protein LOC133172128 [Saccostrea echinata]
MFFGCQETDALYCGAKLPINQKLGQNNSAFSAAVSDCNGKIQCNVSAQYFKDTEADLRKLCSQSNPSELKKASFRQSIDYECIQDYQVIDMCTNRNDSRSPHVYLQLSGDWGSCSCDIIGDISRVNILQTDMAEVLIYNESRRLFQHQHSSVSLYGVEVQVITKKLLIHIQGRSAASRILIKVLGNMTIHCEELKSMSTLQDQDPTSTPLTSVETHQKGEQMLRHSSIGPNVTDVNKPSLPSTMGTHASRTDQMLKNSSTGSVVMEKSVEYIRRAFQEKKRTTKQVLLLMSAERNSTLNSVEILTSSKRRQGEIPAIFRPIIYYSCSIFSASKLYDSILNSIQLSFGGILILLVIFLICKQRSQESNGIQVKDMGERFVLVFPPKQKDCKKSIEIHRADCLCNQSENSETPTSRQNYTPLQALNEISTYTELSLTNEYIDVVRVT